MHPEILRELTSQRGREMRARAHEAMLARKVSRILRGRRRGSGMPEDTDGFVIPAVPDYVDGSFRVTSADGRAARADGQAARADGQAARADGQAARADGQAARADGQAASQPGRVPAARRAA